MSPHRNEHRFPPPILLLATLAMLGLLFFFGLRFEGFAFTNGAQWSRDGLGLRFAINGMAYSEITLPACAAADVCPFTIETAIRPDVGDDGRFKIILMLHGGKDAAQFLIGQWRTSLVIMNGDDYDGRRGQPRTGVRNAFSETGTVLVAVTSGPQGTSVFLNGKKVRHHRSLKLALPAGTEPLRLILGNSGYVRHSWEGVVNGVALYERVLEADRLTTHFRAWSREKAFDAFLADDPTALYTFTESGGTEARELSGKNPPLAIPRELTPFQRDILAPPGPPRWTRTYVEDVVVNLSGFIPMGLLLGALFTNGGVRSRGRALILTVGCCLVISLSIELAQAWIPSRSSELTDLALNVTGGGLGAWLLEPLERRLFRTATG